jgi:uncharacterized membrane protein
MPENLLHNENTENKPPSDTDNTAIPQINFPEEIKTILDELPEPQQKAVKAILIASKVTKASFRSPIPPPEILKRYNEIIPNGAERILNMAEEQSRHRMAMEKDTIKEEQRQSSKGQNFGFIIGAVGLLIAGALAYNGHDWFAGILGTTTLGSLVGTFIYGKKSQQNDLSQK